jgi:hypothetical protein
VKGVALNFTRIQNHGII